MKIDRPTFINTIEYSPFGLSGNEDQRVVRDPDDLKLLNQLLSLATYESYKWSEKILLSERISLFSDRVEQLKGRSPAYFEAKPGPFWWRLLALVYVPLNFAIILCSLVFLTELVMLAWAVLFSLIPAFSWFFDYFVYGAAIFLAGAFVLAVVVGFGFALVMAYNPRLASARGYAYVAEDSTAIIVFLRIDVLVSSGHQRSGLALDLAAAPCGVPPCLAAHKEGCGGLARQSIAPEWRNHPDRTLARRRYCAACSL